MRQGFLFLFVGLLLGVTIIALPHPSRWLAAHLTAFLTGLILVVIARDKTVNIARRRRATSALKRNTASDGLL